LVNLDDFFVIIFMSFYKNYGFHRIHYLLSYPLIGISGVNTRASSRTQLKIPPFPNPRNPSSLIGTGKANHESVYSLALP